MGKAGGQNREAHQRINYLYQAAYMAVLVNPGNLGLCRFYVHTLKSITKRLVLRLHPHISRNFCKKCYVLLIPGVSASVRTRGKREKHTVITCMECSTVKRYLWREGHQLWIEQPHLWLQREETT